MGIVRVVVVMLGVARGVGIPEGCLGVIYCGEVGIGEACGPLNGVEPLQRDPICTCTSLGKHPSGRSSQRHGIGLGIPWPRHDKGTPDQANEETVVSTQDATISRQSWPYFQNAPILCSNASTGYDGSRQGEKKKRHAAAARRGVGIDPTRRKEFANTGGEKNTMTLTHHQGNPLFLPKEKVLALLRPARLLRLQVLLLVVDNGRGRLLQLLLGGLLLGGGEDVARASAADVGGAFARATDHSAAGVST